MANVVTVTLNPAVDESTSVDRVVPEDKLRCDAPTFEPGGGGLNVSRVLARLGVDGLALWTRAGTTGEQLSDLLDATEVPHQAIEVSGMTRTNVVVYERNSTHQYRFGMPGPNLSEADLRVVLGAVLEAARGAEYLVLSGSLPPGAPEDLYAQLARATPPHTKVVLDTSGAALSEGLKAGVDLVKPNLGELARWAGRPLEDDAQIQAAATSLVASGHAAHVVVSLGAGGALAVGPDGVFEARAPTVPIRSKVGAGDSMVGGLVLGLTRGLPLDQVLKYGVAAGAAAVMTPGSELCWAEDVWRLEAQTRVRAL